jgi:cyclase
MLKKRIIPKFLLRDGRLVKYVRFFEEERAAGNPVSTAKVYNDYGADELIILDIVPSAASKAATRAMVEQMSREIFMPFTLGGGVASLDDIGAFLRSGADKVAINSAAVRRPAFVAEAARRYGSQCITVSIDYKEVAPGLFRVLIDGGREATPHDPVDWARRMQDAGSGEVLLTSIDRDGTMSGYDLEMVERLDALLEVPLVVSGGAGSVQHCIDALAAGASAIAISSLFLFTDHSPIKLRSHLWSRGVAVRASTGSRN